MSEMEGVPRTRELLLPPAAMLAAFAVVNALIWLALPRPPDYDPCYGYPPPGQHDALNHFRMPAYALLALFGIALVVWLLWTSRQTRGGGRPGIPTIVVPAALAALALRALGSHTASGILALVGVIGWLVGAVAIVVLGIWTLVLAIRPRTRGGRWLAQTLAWYLLLFGIPGTGVFVWLQGSGFDIGC